MEKRVRTNEMRHRRKNGIRHRKKNGMRNKAESQEIKRGVVSVRKRDGGHRSEKEERR